MKIFKLCVVIILLSFLSGCTVKVDSLEKCIEESKTEPFDFVKGSVDVVFPEGTSNFEINKTINEYGLKIAAFYQDRPVARVAVPNGDELYWVCKLRENKRIEFVDVDIIPING